MERLNDKDYDKFTNEIDEICQKHGRDLYCMVFSTKENVFNKENYKEGPIFETFQMTGFGDPAFYGYAIKKIIDFVVNKTTKKDKKIKIDSNHLHMISAMILEEIGYYNSQLYYKYREDVGNPVE